MPNEISGLDAAWRFPNLAGLRAFKAQGGKVVAGYLSYDPSKDWTAARLTMVHGLGLGALMNFEHTANRALSGRAAGVVDGEHAWGEIAALIRAVGYAPKNHLHVYASADFDAQPSQYPTIDAYLLGFASGLLNRHANADQAVYGSYALVVHTATAGTSKAEWQTYAWSGGRFYTGAEYYQWSNSHDAFGAAVDYDQAINLEHLGAWWPPGSTYDRATPAAPTSDPAPAPTTRKRPKMLVVEIVASTVPKGTAVPGWQLLGSDGKTLTPIGRPAPGVNNGMNLLAALGQAHPCPISYGYYLERASK